MELFQVTAPNLTINDTEYEIQPVMPGTTYNLTLSFVNEVGESLDNTVGRYILGGGGGEMGGNYSTRDRTGDLECVRLT